jgi:hypothetical protein
MTTRSQASRSLAAEQIATGQRVWIPTEIEEFYEVSRTRVYKSIRCGTLTSRVIGKNRNAIRHADLEMWLTAEGIGRRVKVD